MFTKSLHPKICALFDKDSVRNWALSRSAGIEQIWVQDFLVANSEMQVSSSVPK